MWIPTLDEAVLMYAWFLKVGHGTAASKFARNTANTLQNEGELKAICFGMLSQMPWTDLPVGLSPGCSTGIEPLNACDVKRCHRWPARQCCNEEDAFVASLVQVATSLPMSNTIHPSWTVAQLELYDAKEE